MRSQTSFAYFTAPAGPPSINNDEDARESADQCLTHLLPLLSIYDAFLVACYSAHPLVPLLQTRTSKPVTGILEASVSTALQLLRPGQAFGIVSTGAVWEELLTRAVEGVLGLRCGQTSMRFVGVETTGLSAIELHDVPEKEVHQRLGEATRRLLRRGRVGAICMGCAGMTGMDKILRDTCVAELGELEGVRVHIIDGVLAGAGTLSSLARGLGIACR
jgi:Asp/Glu/hydantoin racemase